MGKSRYHPRIYPANYPLLDRYPADHPAVRALQAHAEACDVCVAREIQWPDAGHAAIDQHWFSTVRGKWQCFSAFAYEFLSYDLILDGWLELSPEPTESELGFLIDDRPVMELLLAECEEAAIEENNVAILPLIAKAREFIDAYTEALVRRFRDCGITWPRDEADVGNNGVKS